MNYVCRSTFTTITGLTVLALATVGVSLALGYQSQAASADVTNEVQMFLAVNINSSQTTGLIIDSPSRNGADHIFAALSGGVLRIRPSFSIVGNIWEDVHFTSATVNASTNQITLAGVTRNLCPQVTRQYISCGNGRTWQRGSIVELSQDARLFNLKANIDRANTFTARNGTRYAGSGSLSVPTFATTAERDRQLGSAPQTSSGYVACVVATALCYDGVGGAWVAHGSNATPNADTTTSGKVELATTTDIVNRVLTGDSGPIVLTNDIVARRSTGATQAHKIPALEDTGRLSGSLLGNGTVANGSFLMGSGWTAIPVGSGVNLATKLGIQSAGAFSTTSTAFVDIDTTITSANSYVVGDLVHIILMGVVDNSTSGERTHFDIRVGGGRLGVRDGGANGLSEGLISYQASANGEDDTFTLNYYHYVQTGGTLTIRPQWKVSGGTATVVSGIPLYYQVIKIEE